MASFKEIILKIKERPSMYLGANSISCLKAFIDGWHFRDEGGVDDVELMNAFQTWIVNRFSVKGTQSYARIILFYSQDECSALTTFFELFDFFLIEHYSI
jgi:hypothetical protein